MSDSLAPQQAPRGSSREVLWAFVRQGCLSFGGPIAHLGYFHAEFVGRRKWCDEQTFGEIVAIAQTLPGPASSQVGFALGLLRAGWLGGAAAWLGFTMPSALLMLAFAFGHTLLTGKVGSGIVHGLQLVAVAVVAQAILAMRKSLAPDLPRMALALVAAAVVLINAGSLLAIIAGALLGLLLRLPPQDTPSFALHFGISKRGGLGAAAAFVAILLLLPANAWLGTHTGAVLGLAPSGAGIGGGAVYGKSGREALSVFSAFYRTGAMVFGGGHVVLPLLENAVVARGWVDQQSFLAGYGAAQALPGPLFTFAAYLGAAIQPTPNRVVLSALALAAIFLPGLLLIVAVLPFWNGLRQHPRIQSSLRGVNAAVLGILVAAFVRPVWSSAVHTVFDVGLAISALALLVRWKLPPWILVVTMASVSAIAAAFLS